MLASNAKVQERTKQDPGTTAVLGMLTEMSAKFDQDLTDTQEREIEAAKTYEELRVSRNEQAKHMRKQIASKSEAMTAAAEAAADAKIAVSDTGALLESLDNYVNEAAITCKNAEAAYQLRLKERSEETQAIGKAVEVLFVYFYF